MGYIRQFSINVQFMIKPVLFKGKINSVVGGTIRGRLYVREAITNARVRVDLSTKISLK